MSARTSKSAAPALVDHPITEVRLGFPVMRGETEIRSVMLRKPYAPELRGLKFNKLMDTDFDEHIKLLPRITVPPLIEQEVQRLDPSDLSELMSAVVDFFMTPAQRERVQTLMKQLLT